MTRKDTFGTRGEKYRYLLGVPPGTPVYLSGSYWEGLADDFSRAGLHPVRAESEAEVGFLALRSTSLLGSWLRPSGTGRPRRVVALVGQRPGLPGWTRGRRTRLTPSTDHSFREFLPLPSLAAVEAFVAPSASTDAWALRRGGLSRFLARLRLPLQHRLLFLLPQHALDGFRRAEAVLSRATGQSEVVVERYHLRRRGAIVFVLTAPSSARYVLRVATNDAVAALSRRNHQALRALVATHDLPDPVRQALPLPIGELADEDATAFAEEYRPGRLAWTLYRTEPIRRRIDADLFRFSHALQVATCGEGGTDGAVFEAVSSALDLIAIRLGHHPGIAERLGEIGRRTHGLLRRRRRLAFAHGDFGVGNALVEPDGVLSGIIDWDQSRPRDLPGLDWCNHVIKSQHYRRSTLESLRALVLASTTSGMLAPGFGGFGRADFELDEADMRLIPCLAAVWDLARSAPFDSELTGDAGHYRALLDGILELLPTGGSTGAL